MFLYFISLFCVGKEELGLLIKPSTKQQAGVCKNPQHIKNTIVLRENTEGPLC